MLAQHLQVRRWRCADSAAASAGLISASDFVQLVSTSVARIFGIYPQKGHIAAGSDADVIIFDPHQWHTISAASHHSAMDTNIYEGMTVKGKVCLQPRVLSYSSRKPRMVDWLMNTATTLLPDYVRIPLLTLGGPYTLLLVKSLGCFEQM